MRIKQHPEQINIDEYDYPLPDERIAQFPLDNRERSKLLVYHTKNISQDNFFNLGSYIPEGSLMVFNETRVVHARLIFKKDTGSFIEIFCLEPLWPYPDHFRAFQQKAEAEWKCLVGNSKRWKHGFLELEALHNGVLVKIQASRKEKSEGGSSDIRFSWEPAEFSFAEVLEAVGKIPLPPYIHRDPVDKDESTYQTIYAKQDGSVAAPTAGLHFSDGVMDTLKKKNIDFLKLTLHVGAGTFKPVTSKILAGHEMHAEQVYLPVESLESLHSSLNKPIIAVGTTTTRLLESLYWHGVKVIQGISPAAVMDVRQWDPYQKLIYPDVSTEEALNAVIEGCKMNSISVIQGKTSLMIAPGYKFRYPDILITNFHQPRSTLLLLIAAFIGEDWKKAYRYALEHDFRFLSYGDSCLLFKS